MIFHSRQCQTVVKKELPKAGQHTRKQKDSYRSGGLIKKVVSIKTGNKPSLGLCRDLFGVLSSEESKQ